MQIIRKDTVYFLAKEVRKANIRSEYDLETKRPWLVLSYYHFKHTAALLYKLMSLEIVRSKDQLCFLWQYIQYIYCSIYMLWLMTPGLHILFIYCIL